MPKSPAKSAPEAKPKSPPPELAPLLGSYTSRETGGAFRAEWTPANGFTFSRIDPDRLLLGAEHLDQVMRQLRFNTFIKTT